MSVDSTNLSNAIGNKNDPILIDQDDVTTPGSSTISEKQDDKQLVVVGPNDCPYLGTIDRKALDFDFEKLCSVSLSKVNVYACLVCGKYFQGRGKSTHAFIHSVSESHHVYLNLETLKFYCLPDNYEINDPSLDDILYVLRPTFTKEDLAKLTHMTEPVQAYNGKHYYPGIVGLNNLKENDYCNVIFQALSHVIPLRNYFLIRSKPPESSRAVDQRNILSLRFGELLRKLWNPKNFKTHVSPHEMLQAIILTSNKRFEFTKQGDAIVFLGWFLNSLLGVKREKDSVVKRTFQGKIRIASRLLLPDIAATATETSDLSNLIPAPEETFSTTSFMYLTLDLPSMPLFPKKDERGRVIKPRVSIHDLLAKFDGKTVHEFRTYTESTNKRYEILKLPHYLIIFYKRFTQNTFFTDKNTHIINFPLNNLNLTHLIVDETTGENGNKPGDDSADIKIPRQYNYDLVANIVHDGEPGPGKGTYRAQILHRGTGKWFEMQDLSVTEMADTMLITLSETYIQVWELQQQSHRQGIQ